MSKSTVERSIYYYDFYTRNKIGNTDKYDYSAILIKNFFDRFTTETGWVR